MKRFWKKACSVGMAALFVIGLMSVTGSAYAEENPDPVLSNEEIPGTVTVKFDLGAGHEAWAQSDMLKEKIENYGRKLSVVGVEGSVISVKVPPYFTEPDRPLGQNYVNGLSSALDIVLSRTISGIDGKYDFPNAFDQGEWLYTVGLKPFEEYSSYDDLQQETEENENVRPVDGQIFYALWAKPVKEVDITIESPLCKTEITADYYDPDHPEGGYAPDTQEPRPQASVSAEHASILVEDGNRNCLWRQEEDSDPFLWDVYVGTVEGGENYLAEVDLRADFGYYFPEDVKINVTGGALDSEHSYTLETFYIAYISVTAEHDWNDWTVTKEATETEEGIETRTCQSDPSHIETRPIPKLEPSAEEDAPNAGEDSPLLVFGVMGVSLLSLFSVTMCRKKGARARK